MAEKKFFVDINLQGSALTNAKIGTNTGIGSTEGAFGYDSASHRLQYFNGTATKDVANLSDIAAVTGGLIFQGGYDPTTDTPDITGTPNQKGFFWVVTVAGSFIGEAVQVGDSLVAKIDNATGTPADWLILQGNVVIATDSVDGISRLATQTEANDGTEGGAVVITPATLQGKIDAQITPEISNKLPLAGGTMLGDINMDGNSIYNTTIFNSSLATDLDAYNNSIINLPTPTNGGDATNKTYVDDNTSNKLPLAGGMMTGSIDMGANSLENVSVINVTNVIATRTDTEFLSAIEGPILVQSNLDLENSSKIINLTNPTNALDAANKQYVDTTAATAESNANAYTDTQFVNKSYYTAIPTSAWQLELDGTYSANVLHELNISGGLTIATAILVNTHYDGSPADFAYHCNDIDNFTVFSNFIPSLPVSVSVAMAQGNA